MSRVVVKCLYWTVVPWALGNNFVLVNLNIVFLAEMTDYLNVHQPLVVLTLFPRPLAPLTLWCVVMDCLARSAYGVKIYFFREEFCKTGAKNRQQEILLKLEGTNLRTRLFSLKSP